MPRTKSKSVPRKCWGERTTTDANGFVIDIELIEMPDKRRKSVKAAKKVESHVKR